MMETFLFFFTDPVLRAPILGSMLMCCAAALVGVVVFLRKQALLGESLSHASYPGVILGVMFAGLLAIGEDYETSLILFILAGAFITSLLGLAAIRFLEQKMHVNSDAALCFVLATFYGIGITLASHVQFSNTSNYRKVQTYLYGQAATMTDIYIWIYGGLLLFVIATIILFYKELQALTFDRSYANTLGIPTKKIDLLLFSLIAAAVVIGIRSVGVVLMSAMLIGPPAAARQFTDKFSVMLWLAAFFGGLSAYFGNVFSTMTVQWALQSSQRLTLPTGPMIVLMAALFCFIGLLFAPERGLFWRRVRIIWFRTQCQRENLLKSLWRHGYENSLTYNELLRMHNARVIGLSYNLLRLRWQGWIEKDKNGYRLTSGGKVWAANIVRLHRLWEVYLSEYLRVGGERVHRSAEEMEHIITPDLERELTLLLKDPKLDPHHQPIPPRIL